MHCIHVNYIHNYVDFRLKYFEEHSKLKKTNHVGDFLHSLSCINPINKESNVISSQVMNHFLKLGTYSRWEF